MIKLPKIGDKIYVESSFYISHGSDDVIGGIATISTTKYQISGGKRCLFVEVKEHPGNSYNWTQFLSKKQSELKKEFGRNKARTQPDIDTPWIEAGDIVSYGTTYRGKKIW